MDWLFNKDNYIPLNDKNKHIDKSVLSLLGILSRIRQEDKFGLGGLYKVSSHIKFFFTILLVVFLSLSRNNYFVLLLDSYALLMLSLLSLKDIKKIFFITFIVFLFSMILLLPSMLMGNFINSILINFKIFGSVMLLNLLAYTSKSRYITRSLKLFFIPDILILIMDMTIKYIVILGDLSINMLYALKLKSVGKDKTKHTSLANLIGVLFLKSKDMAEDTYFAMECRCFNGKYKSKIDMKLHLLDIIYILVNIVLIILFFLIK